MFEKVDRIYNEGEKEKLEKFKEENSELPEREFELKQREFQNKLLFKLIKD